MNERQHHTGRLSGVGVQMERWNLSNNGFQVLPPHNLPHGDQDFIEFVDQLLYTFEADGWELIQSGAAGIDRGETGHVLYFKRQDQKNRLSWFKVVVEARARGYYAFGSVLFDASRIVRY